MGDYLTKRGGFWHYVRRVPEAFTAWDKRGIIRQSTKIRIADDPNAIRARRAAHRMDADLEAYWRSLVNGQSEDARKRYDAARTRARLMGFSYRPAAELLSGSAVELLTRIEALDERDTANDAGAVAALLGREEPPALRLSGLFAAFERHQRASNDGMSKRQRQIWTNRKKRAVANLITVVGDKALSEIVRSDAISFRTWWQERVLDEGVEITTANKDMGQVDRMWRVVNQLDHLGLPDRLFSEIRIEGGEYGKRAAFAPEFVQNQLLKTGALAGLNAEARCTIYVMVETGLRPSEIVNLNDRTIHLDGDIPYVSVLPDGRRMKTRHSKRDIPLVGVALMACRAFPNGFPRYHDGSASLSALVNKFLDNNGLRPTENHTLYSLRHTFKDRLRSQKPPQEMLDELMGHDAQRPAYGDGWPLLEKLKLLSSIAFKPPASV